MESPTIYFFCVLSLETLCIVISNFSTSYIVIFFSKLGKTNSLKIERAIWHLYFPTVFYLLSKENLRREASFRTFSFERETVLKVASTTEFFHDFYNLEKAALWINKKLMKEIKYLRLEYLRKKWQEKKLEKDHFNNVQKYGQLAGPEVEARS